MLPGVVEMLLSRGIATVDDGAVVVWFPDHPKLSKQETPLILRKKDGAFLYSTTDIATVLYRRDRWDLDRAIYVVDKRQGGHFDQLFEVMRLLGVTMRLEHVGFGMVLGPDGTPIKTRAATGEALTLASLLDEAEERAATLMKEQLKLPPEQVRELAAAVGIGAVKYADLSQNRLSDYKFDWDKLISLSGNCGPYMQYAHARCCSMLRKGEVDPASLDPSRIRLADPHELTLARRLIKLPDVVHSAAEQCYPHYVADHLYGLARDLSVFYEHCPVLKSEGDVRESRLALVDLARRQLARGLGLLGIEAPERM
jgi:arginyl-tRNA synthetase